MTVPGDDLIGPRDIKRGVHLLTNADMAILNIEEDDESPEQQTSRPRRKRRDSAILRGEKLTEEQITQAGLCCLHINPGMLHDALLGAKHTVFQFRPRFSDASHHDSVTVSALHARSTLLSLLHWKCPVFEVHICVMQIHERIGQEIDPEGAGLSYSDFENIASRMPDFFFNFKMSV